MTDDTTTVIVRRYSVVESDMVAKVGWEEPRHFDALMDRIHAGKRSTGTRRRSVQGRTRHDNQSMGGWHGVSGPSTVERYPEPLFK
jgi:hypothetical protein